MTTRKTYRPPLASLATRNINQRSRGHSSGFLMIATKRRPQLRKIVYESILEKNFLMLMAVRDDVVDILEQPKAVNYSKASGALGRHTYDFLVELDDSTWIAAAIKPHQRAEKLNFRSTLELIAAATPKSFADTVMLVTDRDLDPDAARMAARDLMLRNRSLMEDAQ